MGVDLVALRAAAEPIVKADLVIAWPEAKQSYVDRMAEPILDAINELGVMVNDPLFYNFDVSSDTLNPEINFRRSRGTPSAKTPVQTGSILSETTSWGWDGSAWQVGSNIIATAAGASGVGSVPTSLAIKLGNGTSLSQVMALDTTRVQIQGAVDNNSFTTVNGTAYGYIGSGELTVLSSQNRSGDGGIILLGGSSGASGFIKSGAVTGNAGRLLLGTRSAANGDLTTRICIDYTGYVGIGTVSPNAALVVQTVGTNASMFFGTGVSTGYAVGRLYATDSYGVALGANSYYNGSSHIRICDGGSADIFLDASTGTSAGDIMFASAPSGAAGGAVSYLETIRIFRAAGVLPAYNASTTPGLRIKCNSATADDRIALALMHGFEDWGATDRRVSMIFYGYSDQPWHYFGRVTGGRNNGDGGRGYLAFHAGSDGEYNTNKYDQMRLEYPGYLYLADVAGATGGVGGRLTFRAKDNSNGVPVDQGQIRTHLTNGAIGGHSSVMYFATAYAGALSDKLMITEYGPVQVITGPLYTYSSTGTVPASTTSNIVVDLVPGASYILTARLLGAGVDTMGMYSVIVPLDTVLNVGFGTLSYGAYTAGNSIALYTQDYGAQWGWNVNYLGYKLVIRYINTTGAAITWYYSFTRINM